MNDSTADTLVTADADRRVIVVIRHEQIVFRVFQEAVVFNGTRRRIGLRIARCRVAPEDVRNLDVVAVIAKKLTVKHIVAGLEFRVDSQRVERIHNIHWRKDQAVAPGDHLPTKPKHYVIFGIGNGQPVHSMQGRELVLIPQYIRQVHQAPVVGGKVANTRQRGTCQIPCQLNAVTVACV